MTIKVLKAYAVGVILTIPLISSANAELIDKSVPFQKVNTVVTNKATDGTSTQIVKTVDAKADAKAKREAEAKAKAVAQAKSEAEAAAKLKAEADARQKVKEERLKAKADAKAKREAEAAAKLKAEADARQKVKEERLKAKADAKAKREAEAKAKAEAQAKSEAEAAAKLKAEADARQKAKEDRLKAKAEAKAKHEAEVKAKAEAQAKSEAEAAAKLKAEADARQKAKDDKAAVKDQKQPAETVSTGKIHKPKQPVVNSSVETEIKASAEKAMADFKARQQAEAMHLNILNKTNAAQKTSDNASGLVSSETALQRATSGLVVTPKSEKDAIRVTLFGFHASPEQKEKMNERYAYNTSNLTVMPVKIGKIALRPRITLVNGELEIYNTLADKKAAEEFFSYHPRHSQIFAAYVTRLVTLHNGATGGVSLDKGFMNELTYDFANTPILSSNDMKKAQDQYLYITNRLTENDRIKFWNWLNSIREGEKMTIPNWVVLADILHS